MKNPGYKSSLLAMLLASTGTQTFAHPGLHHEIETLSARLKQAPNNIDLLIERGRLCRLDDYPSGSLIRNQIHIAHGSCVSAAILRYARKT